MSVFILDYNGYWNKEIPVIDDDGNEGFKYEPVLITDVPVNSLLQEWESLVNELSHKEVELYNLKEAYLIAESRIVNETDFKEIYGANNQKIRDQHVKSELADMVQQKASLQFSIDFIRNYIPLLRECIRSKQSYEVSK